MTLLDIINFIIIEIIAISRIILRKNSGIIFKEIPRAAVKITEIEGVVLRVIKVIIVSKAIIEAVTNFLKIRLI